MLINTPGSWTPLDDTAWTPAANRVLPSGHLASVTSYDAVQEGDIGASGMTLDRKQHVVAELESNGLRIFGVTKEPQFATISAHNTGWTQIVGPQSTRIRVLRLSLANNTAAFVQFQSNTTMVSGSYALNAKDTLVEPYCPHGLFQTSVSQALGIDISVTTDVGGTLTWVGA